MIQPRQRILSILAVTTLALGLSACGKNEDQTAGQRLDSAVARTEQAADNAAQRTEEATRSAGARIEAGAERAGDAASNAADRVGDATSNAANNAMNVAGEATTTAEIKAALVKDSELSALQINVDTKDGVVTLNGTAPSESAKTRAGEIAKGVGGVKSVNNMLTVQAR
ncbi:BON domain-containing protein [Comamonas endophytica]|uniref:BON domain-containing protein n=1 Tax=Comamonas endophytica TaxID=2949090 RepID=A0ABY6G9J7_9BURK|nr:MULTISPECIES: BON domain-containing protein [unclassified Acidovorax]MCD2511944.1 BON domain-containing protein [Acidovorax sp. D4N7]UYG51661.1 BON domain-containing protein [Acidovorax sp. 5MLIR]UYG51731.1 BON domain-containing protein [Acidovorax sp. 5MLIR]